MRRRILFQAVAAAFALCALAPVHAQSDRPIRLLVGFPPGGSTDMVARVLAEKLRAELGRTVLVENRPGAGGRVASLALKNSPPDGSTYVVMPNAVAVLNHILYPVETLQYDVQKDMAPVAMLVSYPMGMAVNAKLGVSDARQYIAWVKKSGQAGLYGTAGQGGQTHFTGLELGRAAGVEMKVVPYRGNGPMLTDLLGGQVPAGIGVAGDFVQHAREGQLRIIGIFGSERSPLVPDVPTFKEQGFDVDTGDAWTGIWAPTGVPAEERERVQEALRKVLATEDIKTTFAKANMVPDYRPGAELERIIDKEIAYWRPIIKDSGFTPEQ